MGQDNNIISNQFNFDVGTKLKIVYTESFGSASANPPKVFYGRFQNHTNSFVCMKYNNSEDEAFININSIILISVQPEQVDRSGRASLPKSEVKD